MSFLDVAKADFENMLQAEFAEEVTVTSGGSLVTIKAVFDETYLMVDPESQMTVRSTKPRVTFARALVPFPIYAIQTSVTARGKTYRVREPQSDGEGSITLYLD